KRRTIHERQDNNLDTKIASQSTLVGRESSPHPHETDILTELGRDLDENVNPLPGDGAAHMEYVGVYPSRSEQPCRFTIRGCFVNWREAGVEPVVHHTRLRFGKAGLGDEQRACGLGVAHDMAGLPEATEDPPGHRPERGAPPFPLGFEDATKCIQ